METALRPNWKSPIPDKYHDILSSPWVSKCSYKAKIPIGPLALTPTIIYEIKLMISVGIHFRWCRYD